MKRIGVISSISGALLIAGLFATSVSAYRFSSMSYVIDASVAGNSMGGSQGSTSYKLTGSGGESIVGNGSGGSYKVGMGYVSQLPRSLSLTVQPSGLVGYWPLDEPSGTSTADRGLGSHTANAAATPTRVAGKIGGALGPVPTGSNTYFENGDTNAFNNPYLTVCAWANKSATATNPTLVARATGVMAVDGLWHLGYGNGQKMRFITVMNGGVSNLITSNATIPLNEWHHFCGTYDGTQMILYIDGIIDSSLPLSGTLAANTTPLTIGARYNGVQSSEQQSVDEVMVFSRALSADEIKAIYSAQNIGIPSGISLGEVTPGVSNNVSSDVVVQTDASGYSLAINQDQDLTSGSYTIPAITSGTIASPAAWTEGTTKGLGFTLTGTNATAISGVWSGGANYAAFPASATTFYARMGQPTTKDYVTMKLRLDVASSQAATATPYTNLLTVTGTMTP